MIKICMSLTSHALDPPPPVTNCHTFLDPLPLERDVLYGRPITKDSSHCLTVKLRFGHSLQVHTSSASSLQNADRMQTKTDPMLDRQLGIQIDRQTDRQTDKETDFFSFFFFSFRLELIPRRRGVSHSDPLPPHV